mgnify:CR=1 FL=1
MQTSHARTIRGLSIAVVILSILSILGLIFSLAFIGVGSAALGNEEVRGAASYSLSMDPDSAYTMEQLGITEDDAFGMLGFLLGLPQQAGGLLAGAEQLKIQRFIIRRGKHPLSSFLGDSLPRRTPKQT